MRGVTFEKTLFCVKNVVRKIQQINSEFVHSSQFSNQTATTEKRAGSRVRRIEDILWPCVQDLPSILSQKLQHLSHSIDTI